jgi:hypothetical protein
MEEENAVIEAEEVAEVAESTPAEDAPQEELGEEVQPAEDEAAEVEETPKPKGVQRRIDELTRMRREAERRADRLEALLEKTITKQPEPVAPAPEPVTKPVLDQFDTYEEYTEALTDWKIDQRDKQRETARQAQKQEETAAAEKQRIDAKMQAAIQNGEGKYSDFYEVALLGNKELTITPQMLGLLAESEAPEDVVYHLGKNPARAQEIAQMPLARQALEIARIEGSLASAAEAKKETAAPPPIKPVGGAHEKSVLDPDSLPIKDWMKLRDEGKIK